LGHAPMRAQPTPQERPEPCHRIHRHFTKAVAIFIAGVLAPSVVDTLRIISPCTQAGIKAVLSRLHKRPWSHGVFDERLHGLLRHMSPSVDDHLTATLHQAKDGWPLLVQGAAPTFTCESVATSLTPLVLHHLRLPFMAGNHIGVVARYLIGQWHGGLFCTIPSRRCVVLGCTSRRFTSSSLAICSVDQFNPMKSRHNIHTFRG
jgi:hypothetical protein